MHAYPTSLTSRVKILLRVKFIGDSKICFVVLSDP
jgi:hypothetical protein